MNMCICENSDFKKIISVSWRKWFYIKISAEVITLKLENLHSVISSSKTKPREDTSFAVIYCLDSIFVLNGEYKERKSKTKNIFCQNLLCNTFFKYVNMKYNVEKKAILKI